MPNLSEHSVDLLTSEPGDHNGDMAEQHAKRKFRTGGQRLNKVGGLPFGSPLVGIKTCQTAGSSLTGEIRPLINAYVF